MSVPPNRPLAASEGQGIPAPYSTLFAEIELAGEVQKVRGRLVARRKDHIVARVNRHCRQIGGRIGNACERSDVQLGPGRSPILIFKPCRLGFSVLAQLADELRRGSAGVRLEICTAACLRTFSRFDV